jgi:hypothetical protein
MSFYNNDHNVSHVASTDLSTSQHKILDMTAAGKVDLAAAHKAYGVLVNKPKAGEHATVQIGGQAKVRAGAAVAIGDVITSAASGWAAVAGGTSPGSGSPVEFNNAILGRALTAAASGSIFTVDIQRQLVAVTSA